MSDAIIDATGVFNKEVLKFSNPKPHSSGGKVVNINHMLTPKESLQISTPLILTWGAQEGLEQGTQKPTGKFSLALQFPTSEYSNPELDAFLKTMRDIETGVKEEALKKSKEWFGTDYTSSDPAEAKFNQRLVNEKFNVMLRHPKKVKGGVEMDLNKPPTLTVKIPQWSGVWKPEIYDENGEPLFVQSQNPGTTPLEFLKPKSHVICLIQCGGLWFINGKVSITWNLKQAIVQKPTESMAGTCFLKIKAADKERLKTLPSGEPHQDDGPVESSTTLVDDSDDEGDAAAEAAPVVGAAEAAPVVGAAEAATTETVAESVAAAVAAVAPVVAVVEAKPKKKIVRKAPAVPATA